ncbi:hypothetical protein [Paenibacillus illinoisensis]|uniref:hypothetical protein n=1 Tax=Paenibacillus illinoisensis TaxID=59845 RepID=UPI00301DA2C8
MKNELKSISCYNSKFKCKGNCEETIDSIITFTELSDGRKYDKESIIKGFELFFEDGKSHSFINVDEQTASELTEWDESDHI